MCETRRVIHIYTFQLIIKLKGLKELKELVVDNSFYITSIY